MSSYERFEAVLKQKNLKPYDVCKATGISSATMSDWKNGKYEPKSDKMRLIAYYLGISQIYLETGKEEEKKSSEGNTYYFSDETAKIAEEIFMDPQRKLLFEASRNVSPQNIELAIQMFKQFQETNPHDDR